VYYLLSGGFALAFTIMFTVGTVYYVQAVGLNPLQLVLVGTALEATCFVFEVPTGVVADTYSRRLSVILGTFILGAGFVLIGIFPLFAVVLLGQVITGIGYTFLSGATEAWLADEIGEEHVGRVYLRGGQIERLAALGGTAISVALASLRLNLPYLTGGTLIILLGACLVVAMPEHGFKPASGEQRRTWRAMGHTLREGARAVRGSTVLLMLLGVQLFMGAASEGFDRLGDAHLLANFTFPALGALQPVVWFGILSIAGSLLSIAATEGLRRRLESISRDSAVTARVLLILNTVSILGVVAFGLAGNFPLAFVALMLKGVCDSLSRPLYATWLVQHVKPEVRATVLSMVSQTNAIGQIAGGPGIGLVGNAVSLRAAIVASGLLLSPALALYARAGQTTAAVETVIETA
jgi:DHA3 family tetracycline resistance protein-like MFS transporter